MTEKALTKPWQKQTNNDAIFEGCLKRRIGMMGNRAYFTSLSTNNGMVMTPNTMRHKTVGEFHGKVSPPKFRPRRRSKVTPKMVAIPSQSSLFRPDRKDSRLAPASTLRSQISMINANAQQGRLIHQFHLHETS